MTFSAGAIIVVAEQVEDIDETGVAEWPPSPGQTMWPHEDVDLCCHVEGKDKILEELLTVETDYGEENLPELLQRFYEDSIELVEEPESIFGSR